MSEHEELQALLAALKEALVLGALGRAEEGSHLLASARHQAADRGGAYPELQTEFARRWELTLQGFDVLYGDADPNAIQRDLSMNGKEGEI